MHGFLHEKYAQLLLDHEGIIIPETGTTSLSPTTAKNQLHKCDAPTIELGGYVVCEGCGLVLEVDMIEKDPPARRYHRLYRHEGTSVWLGSDEDSYIPMKRFYKPLTHFRQHLRAYLFARSIPIPDDVIVHMKERVDIMGKDAYIRVKAELKSIKHQELYRDIFTIIYRLGGVKPTISPEQIDSMCNYFKRWYFHYNRMNRFGKHNCPSVHMLLDIILKEFGHTPYYFIPSLKSAKLRQRVREIYDQVKWCLSQS